jgi:hypothetical protein
VGGRGCHGGRGSRPEAEPELEGCQDGHIRVVLKQRPDGTVSRGTSKGSKVKE